MAKVITVWNHKGGSGKSIITVNLAATLSFMGYRVLHLDLDAQGNSSSRLGFYRHPENISLSFRGSAPLPVLQTEYSENLFVCPGSRESEVLGYSMFCQGFFSDETLSQLLEPLNDNFHFVIIDTPPSSVSPMVNNALMASTHLLVPVDSDGPNALENIDTVFEKYNEVSLRHPKLSFLGIIMNRVGDDFSSNATEDQTISILKYRREDPSKLMFKTKLREYKMFQHASWHDRPIIFHAPKSEATKNFWAFAKEMIKRLEMKKPQLENIKNFNNASSEL